MSVYSLRPYQQDAVDATLKHFRKSNDPAVVVLPTGAGKSLVIAELANLARRRILVLTHVKELVSQNHDKYQSYGKQAGIYSAGLSIKDNRHQVTFASVQSLAPNLSDFVGHFSLVVIDECHRVSDDDNSQYQQVLQHLKQANPSLKVLGLTATPYRLGQGWIYRYHYRGIQRTEQERPFETCIFELPLRLMISQGYLTPPKLVDAPVAQYDFSSIDTNPVGEYPETAVNALLVKYPRVTQAIVEQVVALSGDRQGVMVFAATVKHAVEIVNYLPDGEAALITGESPARERDALIARFKAQSLRYLVNVSVLTTGFDAPHVDLIAILRPTQSVSLYQQMVGRGLRLFQGKKDCLVIDYAGNGIDLYYPEVGEKKPNKDSEPVQVLCPACGFANVFWGKTDSDGNTVEHYGRKCQGLLEDSDHKEACDYRFRFKECPHCNSQNDIAARVCHRCDRALIDPDDQLKAALKLKDAMVMRCAGMVLSREDSRLTVVYHGEEGEELVEWFDFNKTAARNVFNRQFGRRYLQGTQPMQFATAAQVLSCRDGFSAPDFVVARRKKSAAGLSAAAPWRVQEKVFDYQGQYRKANALG